MLHAKHVETKDNSSKRNTLLLMMLVKKGTVLLSEYPFVHVLKSSCINERCNHCLNMISDLSIRCKECQYVTYCSEYCKYLAKSMHDNECKMLSNALQRIIPDSAFLLMRIILKLQFGKVEERSYYDTNWHRTFNDLISHSEDIAKDSSRVEHFISLCGVLRTLFGHAQLPPEDVVLQIYGKICVNSFTIVDESLNDIAVGLFLSASMIDHSCNANCIALFSGPTIYIRTVKDIPDFDWSLVSISYIDELNTKEERRKELQNNYYFLCQCIDCITDDKERLMNSLHCPNTNCNHPLTKVQLNDNCGACGTIITSNQLEKYDKVTKLSNSHISSIKENEIPDSMVSDFEKCLKMQLNVLHPYNIRNMKMLDAIMDRYCKMQDWDKSIFYGKQLIAGYRKHYNDRHPQVILLHMKLGKMLLLKNKDKQAQKLLKLAKDLINLTHGETHPLYKNLISLLNEVNIS